MKILRKLHLSTCFTLALAIFFIYCLPQSQSIHLPNLRLTPWPKSSALDIISSYKTLDFNHPKVGLVSNLTDSAPKGFNYRRVEVYLCKGMKVYHCANDILVRFDMVNKLPWMKIVHDKNDIDIGCNLAMMVKSYGLIWSLNPCRIVQKIIDSPYKMPQAQVKGEGKIMRYSEVAYCTLQGHLIAGEERFRVYLRQNEQGDELVSFEVCSFSRGSGFLGPLVFPFIKPMQTSFFKDVPKAMIEELNNRI